MWVLFALAAALGDAFRCALNKKVKLDEYTAAWCASAVAAPILLIAVVLTGGFPAIAPTFWGALLTSGVINVVTSTLYVRAIKSSDLTLTVPMAAFTPLFLLVTSPLINGEFPGAGGLAGVLFIVVGSYMLNLKSIRNGVLGPFRALLREPGPKIMLFVAFLWSISSNFDKIGIAGSSPLVWAFSISSFISLGLLPIVISKGGLHKVRTHIKEAAALGALYAITVLAHAAALGLTLVAYAISFKRLSILFGVMLGGYVFRERDIAAKVAGALVMFAGVILIALS